MPSARRKNIFWEFLILLLAKLALGLPDEFAGLAVLAQPTLSRLLQGREMFGLNVFRADGSAVTEEGGQRLRDSADLLDRELSAFLRRIKRTALLIKIILNRLLTVFERGWIKLGVLPGEELNGPLIEQLFGGELFSHAQFRERAVELEWRDLGVWLPYQQL